MSSVPRVSIGLPVYNGERYLNQALDSICGQTFGDFELVISDNASSDRTREICEAWAARDSRIHYHRQTHNLGVSRNFMACLQYARGEFFKWAAHDDWLRPTFLERAVEALDRNPDSPLAFCDVEMVNAAGEHLQFHATPSSYESHSPVVRFWSLASQRKHCPYEFFGLIRRSELMETRGMSSENAADFLLLYELLWRGRFIQIQEPLLVARLHPEQSMALCQTSQDWVEHFDPRNIGTVKYPYLRSLLATWQRIRTAPMQWYQKLGCFFYYLWPSHTMRHVRHLLKELRRVRAYRRA